MNLDELEQKASVIVVDAQRMLDRLHQDQDLRPEVVRHRMARVIVEANRERVKLRDQYLADVESRRRALQKEVAAPPTDPAQASSYRDVLQRLDNLKDEPNFSAQQQAVVLAERAVRGGDEVSLKALAAVSSEKGWRHVLEIVSTELPGLADTLKGLAELNQSGRNARFRLDILTSPMGGSGISELRGYTPKELERLAEHPPEPPPSRPGRARDKFFSGWKERTWERSDYYPRQWPT